MGDRRMEPRKLFKVPLLGAIYATDPVGPEKPFHSRTVVAPRLPGADTASSDGADSVEPATSFFVDVCERSDSGALVRSPFPLPPWSIWRLIYADDGKSLHTCTVRVSWSDSGPPCTSGLEVLEESPVDCGTTVDGVPFSESLKFLAGISLLEYLPREAWCDLLNCLKRETWRTGERLISQGEPGDFIYMIQKGSCAVKVESEGQLQQVDRIRWGELAGEMAIVTGEPRTAHVDCETDLIAWKLGKNDFDAITERYPDLLYFLSELVISRFDFSPFTRDRVVGNYVIKRKLGRGGWSVVYKGQHRTLKFPVAIKMMRHDMALNASCLERFKKEAELIAGMNHPNLVRVYDIEELYRTVFIIMEYLEGQPLDHMLKQAGRLTFPEGLNIIIQALAGLGYAHRQGVVHQDIKPANIFVLPNNHVKLLDFGLACTAGSSESSFLPTLQYTAPEQVLGNPITPRTDIYAIGLTAWEMFCGKRPYPEDDFTALIDMHVKVDVPDPALSVPDIPEPVRNFILKACARDPDKRYSNAREAVLDVLPLARKLGCLEYREGPVGRRVKSLLLSYSDDQEPALKTVLEQFGRDLKEMGVALRSAEFEEV